MKKARLVAGLFRVTPPRHWPNLAWYFTGLAAYRLTGWKPFSEKVLVFRPFRLCASIEGVSGLLFLHEILTERIYDFNALQTDKAIRVIFDAGANCGFFALTESSRNAAVRIFCFEPHPRTVERLQANIRVNNRGERIIPVHAAVGAECGTCELNTASDSSMGVVSTSQTQYVKPETVVRTRLLTLDSYAKEHDVWPDLIKVDVEGFEVEALRGAQECLKYARHVVLEYHTPSLLDECRQLLAKAGFETRISENRLLIACKQPAAHAAGS